MKLQNHENPIPKDNEILVKIHATTVTMGDVRMRGFKVPLSFWLPAHLKLGMFKPKQPILGLELAGEIEEIGKDVTLFKKRRSGNCLGYRHWELPNF